MPQPGADSATGTSSGLLYGIIRLVVIVGAVLVMAAIGFVIWLTHVWPPDKEDDNAVDLRPAGLRTVQDAAGYMETALAAKQPYPTVQQMMATGSFEPGMEVTIHSSDTKSRAYCISAFPAAEHLTPRGEPVRYYIHRPASTPLSSRPLQATTTPCT